MAHVLDNWPNNSPTMQRLTERVAGYRREWTEIAEARAALSWCRANGNPHREQGK